MAKNMLFADRSEASTSWSSCTVVTDSGAFCDAPIPPGAPISACKRHLVSAFLYCENLIIEANAERVFGLSAAALAEERALRERELRRPAVVYYARIDGCIKIGTTIDLDSRMNALAPECLLATEAGSYDLEKARHRQFAKSKAPRGREYFHPTEDLMAHILTLQHATAEALRWPPLRGGTPAAPTSAT